MPQPQMPAMSNWRFAVDVERIGWLTIDTPKSPVNTLSRQAIAELETALMRVAALLAAGDNCVCRQAAGLQNRAVDNCPQALGCQRRPAINQFPSLADF